MISHGIDFSPLVYSLSVSLAVLVVGTPLAWRALAGAPRAARALGGGLACVGAAGIAALLLDVTSYRLDEMVLSVVVLSALFQGAVALLLLLLTRRGG